MIDVGIGSHAWLMFLGRGLAVVQHTGGMYTGAAICNTLMRSACSLVVANVLAGASASRPRGPKHSGRRTEDEEDEEEKRRRRVGWVRDIA